MVFKAQKMTTQCNHLLKLEDLHFFRLFSRPTTVELYMKSAVYYLTNTLGVSRLCQNSRNSDTEKTGR